MYKIDKRGKGWGSKIRILPLVMYKIDRTGGGGGVQKLFTLMDPKHAHYHFIEIVTFFCLVGNKNKKLEAHTLCTLCTLHIMYII